MEEDFIFFVKVFDFISDPGNEEVFREEVLTICGLKWERSSSDMLPLLKSVQRGFMKPSDDDSFIARRIYRAGNDKGIDFHLGIDSLKTYHRILPPNSFLAVPVKMNDCGEDGASDVAVYRKIPLKDMLASAGENRECDFLFRLGSSTEPSIKKLTVTVCLGWAEAAKDPMNIAPMEDTPLKLHPVTFMQGLFERESSKDCAAVAKNGAEVRCHSLLLIAHSGMLKKMESLKGIMLKQRGEDWFMMLPESSEDGVRYFLNYLYCLHLDNDDCGIPSNVAVELFQTARKYELAHLEDLLRKLFLGKGFPWFHPEDVLELFVYTKDLAGYADLREHCREIRARIRSSRLKDNYAWKNATMQGG